MNNQNKIDFTNLANKKSKDPIYITIVVGVILVCTLLFLIFFTDVFKKKEEPINEGTKTISDDVSSKTPTSEEELVPPEAPAPEPVPTENPNKDNTEVEEPNNLESTLNTIEKAKLSTFVSNVQLLFKNSQIQYVSEAQNGKYIDEISPRNNSVETTLDYCVKLDKGKVIKIQAQDSLFSIELDNVNSVSNISSKDVKKGKIASFDCK